MYLALVDVKCGRKITQDVDGAGAKRKAVSVEWPDSKPNRSGVEEVTLFEIERQLVADCTLESFR